MGSDSGCKVDTAIERYELDRVDPQYDRINDGLLARWIGEQGEPSGYRPLTEWFNKRILKRVYDDHGRDTVGPRLESEFQALTDDDSLAQSELIADLAASGIDAERVIADMVSWGTMRTHLCDCLDGQKEAPHAETDWEYDCVEMACEFAEQKVTQAISSLETKEDLRGPASVEIQVQLQCEACPTRVPLSVALDRGYVCEAHSD